MEKKFLMFEYLSVLIDYIQKAHKSGKKQYNYNTIAEQFANQFKIARKEKEALIELLEDWFPPAKRDLEELRTIKRERPTLKRPQQPGSGWKDAKEKGVGTGRSVSKNSIMDLTSTAREAALQHLTIEDAVRHARKRIGELKYTWKKFEDDSMRYMHNFKLLNGLRARISPNMPQAKVEELVGGDRVLDFIDLPKSRDEDNLVAFSFASTAIFMRNIRVDDALLYYAIASYGHFDTITVVSPHPVARAT